MSGIRLKCGAGWRKAPNRTAWCLSLKPYWGKPTVRNFRGGGWKRERWLDEAPAPQSKERRSETPNLRLRAPVLYPTALIIAWATPTTYGRGQSSSLLEDRGLRGLHQHAEDLHVADPMIEAGTRPAEVVVVHGEDLWSCCDELMGCSKG